VRQSSGFTPRLLALLAVLALVLAACGGDSGESEEEREAEEAGGVCSGEAIAAEELGLPDDFPEIDGMVLVEAAESGPSNTADGYFDGDIQSAYDAIKTGIEGAGYAVTFDEIEEDDAEITYATPDESSTGIVALRATCGGEDPVAVHITNRPA